MLSDRIWPLVGVFLVLTGLQLFVFGLMSDVLLRQYFSTTEKPYKVRIVFESE